MSRRKKLGPEARKQLFDRLFKRDRIWIGGGWRVRCTHCGRFVSHSHGPTVIDHRDNDPGNDGLENLQLLHRRCNYLKDPRGSQKRIEQDQDAGDDDQRSAELRKNRKTEPQFRKWVLEYIEANGPTAHEILVNAASEVVNVSPMTGVRHMKKLCSVAGPLMRYYDSEADQDLVKFRDGRHHNDEVNIDQDERVLPG